MHIAILGGGITGLSAAWHLRKQLPHARIAIHEKTSRLGGWIETLYEQNFLFEKGPHTLRLNHSPHLLSIIRDLNLDILTTAPQARYIQYRGKLRSLTYFLPQLLPHLLREPFLKPILEGETIYDWACRKFNARIAETLFDPMTLGIYAGDIRKLSLAKAFPTLTKGSFFGQMKSSPLFTLKGGMQILIDALGKQFEVHYNSTSANADIVISALPQEGPRESLWVVHLAFDQPIGKKGFGYLVPTQEQESVLGALFDSNIFPEQGDSRITVMVRKEEKEPLQAALKNLQKHLLLPKPIYSNVFLAKDAILQPTNACNFTGVSVESCVERGIRLAAESL